MTDTLDAETGAGQISAMLGLLTWQDVRDLAVYHCMRARTGQDAWVYVQCLRSLADRFDKMSFVNVCEMIADDVRNDRLPIRIRDMIVIANDKEHPDYDQAIRQGRF